MPANYRHIDALPVGSREPDFRKPAARGSTGRPRRLTAACLLATLVAGTLANKDAVGFFSAFKDLNPDVFATGFDADAAAGADQTAASARAAGLRAQTCADIKDAVWRALRSQTGQGPPPHVLICGSLYLAGEVLAASEETWPS